MNIDNLIRVLSDMGYTVISHDESALYMLDPSCVLLGFETFLEYAWVIITAMTGVMLMGWGISLLRGAKNNIFINLRNLTIVFAVLGIIFPIMNFIWGGDIKSAACKTVAVPIERVNEILELENTKKMSSYNQYDEFERVDIYDSGVQY